MAKVYVISQCGTNWGAQLEVTNATLDREKAKQILKDIIIENFEEQEDDDIVLDMEEVEASVDEFTSDDPKIRKELCSDYFDWVNIWCDVIELE